MGLTKRKSLITALTIFFISFFIYLINLPFDYKRDFETGLTRRLLTSTDLIPNTFLSYQIIKNKTIDFISLEKNLRPRYFLDAETPYFFIRKEGALYSSYPILTGLFAIPFYLIPILANKVPTLLYLKDFLKILAIGRVAASFYAATSVALMYLILDKAGKDKAWKYIFTIFYALGTLTWSISSRGLWQHTISQLLVSLVILILLNEENKPKLVSLAGLLCGLLVLIRPSNIVFSTIIGLYIFYYHKKKFIKFCVYTLPTIIFLLIYNYLIFDSPFSEGYSQRGDLGWSFSLIPGLVGFLVSPARSLLFISPPLVLSFFGIIKVFTTKNNSNRHNFMLFLSIAFILSLLLMSKWWGWDGADAFGYRMLTEFLPIITMFSYMVSEGFNKIGKTILIALIVYSIYIQANAVIFRKSRCEREHNWSFYCLQPPKRLPKY
ncbi:hypothetical protein ACFL15_01125 [Patescibacteria group bacterium]